MSLPFDPDPCIHSPTGRYAKWPGLKPLRPVAMEWPCPCWKKSAIEWDNVGLTSFERKLAATSYQGHDRNA